jgi:hypothetical protein
LTKTGYIDQNCATGEAWIGLSNKLGILNNTQFDCPMERRLITMVGRLIILVKLDIRIFILP